MTTSGVFPDLPEMRVQMGGLCSTMRLARVEEDAKESAELLKMGEGVHVHCSVTKEAGSISHLALA
jgi:hypothetical protein